MSEQQPGPPPPGVSARDWAIHEANVQQFGPLPLPTKFWNSPAAGRRIASYPDGTFPIKPDTTERPTDKHSFPESLGVGNSG